MSAPSPTVHLHVLPRRTAPLSNDIIVLDAAVAFDFESQPSAAAIDLPTGEDRRSTLGRGFSR